MASEGTSPSEFFLDSFRKGRRGCGVQPLFFQRADDLAGTPAGPQLLGNERG